MTSRDGARHFALHFRISAARAEDSDAQASGEPHSAISAPPCHIRAVESDGHAVKAWQARQPRAHAGAR